MGNIANIVAGKPGVTGGVSIADLGTTLPTDATTVLDADFVSAGFIGDDGLTTSYAADTDKIKNWGGTTAKVVQTDFSATYQFTFNEALNADVLKTVFGDANVTSSGGLSTVAVNGDQLPHKVFAFDVKDGAARKRIVVPNGQITERGDITYSDSTIVQYQVTVEAFVDAAGNNAYEYTDNGTDES